MIREGRRRPGLFPADVEGEAQFGRRMRRSVRQALEAWRRRPSRRRRRARGFGVGAIEAWTLVASGIFATLLFVDGPALLWARALDPDMVVVFETLTDIGKSDWSLVPVGLGCLWLASRPLEIYTPRRRAQIEAWLGLLSFTFLVVAGSGLIVTLLKRLIGRARPKHFDLSGVLDFSPVSLDASYASFPSGHATTLFAIALVAVFVAPRFRWPILAGAAWLAASRIAVGAHYASDVLAGAAFALWFALRAREEFAARRLVFVRDPVGGYRLKSPRLLASAFIFGRLRIARPQPEPAQ